jgi:ABC-type uncharacterized transport system ATPase subunit
LEQLFEMKGITKRFGSLIANDQVDFTCDRGQVVALLGENGAGKTTLMKIACGLYKPDGGQIYFNGKPVNLHSPKDSIRLGIQMVHQHFMLVDALTVTENVVMGKEPLKFGLFQAQKAEEFVQKAAETYGLQVSPSKRVSELSVGAKQRTEIIKALYQGAELLILDEPTAVLTPQEVEELFAIIGKLKADGRAIIMITHKLKETMAVADQIYVLRHGKMVGKVPKPETDPDQLTELMVGHKLKKFVNTPPVLGELILQVKNLRQRNELGVEVLRGLDLEIHGGEIYGIAGVEGNGQRELLEVLCGITRKWEGAIAINGRNVKGKSTRQILDMGVGCVHSDRIERGSLLELPAPENIMLGYHRSKIMYNKFGFFDRARIRKMTDALFEQYDIRPRNAANFAKNFSGGNLQKIIIAREFCHSPQLMILAYPTRGVDIGVSDIIHEKIVELKKNGTAVLLITSDFDELFKLSDRIGVIYEGAIRASGPAHSFDPNQLGYYMGGGE